MLVRTSRSSGESVTPSWEVCEARLSGVYRFERSIEIMWFFRAEDEHGRCCGIGLCEGLEQGVSGEEGVWDKDGKWCRGWCRCWRVSARTERIVGRLSQWVYG